MQWHKHWDWDKKKEYRALKGVRNKEMSNLLKMNRVTLLKETRENTLKNDKT